MIRSKTLSSVNSDVSRDPRLFQAIYDQNIEEVRQLIDEGSNLEDLMTFRKTAWDVLNYESCFPKSHQIFEVTSLEGHTKIVRLLLSQREIDVNCKDILIQKYS